ncbi:MAG TPA: tRNA glutamyl-Q(34) synthetase GluQRS [Pseudomonadales bacterium]
MPQNPGPHRTDNTYRGRFAPSPTGPLHFGSLLAALASFLDARHNKGQWYVRIEDLDPPREQAGAADTILRTLEAFELYWDGSIVWQSQRHQLYEDICQQLLSENKAYYCTCSRSQLAQLGGVYPGTCRDSLGSTSANPPGTPHAIRLRTTTNPVLVKDRIQASFRQNVARAVGDFVIKRKDGLYAYQLAVVVDDQAQQISHVVRGTDLFDNTPRQMLLQQSLGFEPPEYAHLPVVVNSQGQKLSKQTFAPALATNNPTPILLQALTVLGYRLSDDILEARTEDVLAWAIEHWSINNVPKQSAVQNPEHKD